MSDVVLDMYQLAPEGLARDGEGWIRNVLARSALDFLSPAAPMREAPERECGSDRSSAQVGEGAMARIDVKGRK